MTEELIVCAVQVLRSPFSITRSQLSTASGGSQNVTQNKNE